MEGGIFALLGFLVARLLDHLGHILRRNEREAEQRVAKLESAISLAHQLEGNLEAARSAVYGDERPSKETNTTLAALKTLIDVWEPTLQVEVINLSSSPPDIR